MFLSIDSNFYTNVRFIAYNIFHKIKNPTITRPSFMHQWAGNLLNICFKFKDKFVLGKIMLIYISYRKITIFFWKHFYLNELIWILSFIQTCRRQALIKAKSNIHIFIWCKLHLNEVNIKALDNQNSDINIHESYIPTRKDVCNVYSVLPILYLHIYFVVSFAATCLNALSFSFLVVCITFGSLLKFMIKKNN